MALQKNIIFTKRLSSMKTSKDYQLFLRQWKLHQITDNLYGRIWPTRQENNEGRKSGEKRHKSDATNQHRSRKRNKSMMVMTTYAVGVAVGEFFFGGFADVDNFDFKRQLFSGEGVVAVDIDIEFTHF